MNPNRNRAKESRIGIRRSYNTIVSPRSGLGKLNPSSDLYRASSMTSIILPKLQNRPDMINGLKFPSPLPSIRSPMNSYSSNAFKLTSLPPLLASVKSNKPYGQVQLYCANTHRGIIREHNEDRVMIMTRVQKPFDRKEEKWPTCSFFGLYDGHGGKTCSNFLRDHLHSFIINDHNFPSNPEQAILNGFAKAETQFIEMALKKGEKSGSCAVITLIIGNKCYVGNLGDSRALVSLNEGKECVPMSKDHKPNSEEEKQRIIKAGGEIYMVGENSVSRVLPGRLAISRAFGDIDAKLKEFGGNPNVLIAVPDIRSISIKNNTDFICLGSDGIFDRLSNEEVVELLWERNEGDDPLDKMCKGVERVINEAMIRMSYDNVTVLCVGFQGFINGTIN